MSTEVHILIKVFRLSNEKDYKDYKVNLLQVKLSKNTKNTIKTACHQLLNKNKTKLSYERSQNITKLLFCNVFVQMLEIFLLVFNS